MPGKVKNSEHSQPATRRSTRSRGPPKGTESETKEAKKPSPSKPVPPNDLSASDTPMPDLAPSREVLTESNIIPSKSESQEPEQRRHLPRRSKQDKPFSYTEDDDPSEFLMAPASVSDFQDWKGWCEIESEPAFFNVMLREFGVAGVRVQEVVSLDDEMLNFLPKPVYGLIFLFQFKEDDPSMQEPTCPDHIWFANQTTSNACASIALLNIIMNISDIELGPTLEQLKEFSMPLTPALRGLTVSNHDYIRQIHNSFSRKMDMLNADLFLSNDAQSKKPKAKNTSKKAETDPDQAGFHFIAFVPIGSTVWKLDGLERQPMKLGDFEQDWMSLARPIIEERMLQYEDNQIQFNLLSLCRDPLLTVQDDLTANILAICTVELQLQLLKPDWKSFVDEQESDKTLRGPDVFYKITPEKLENAKMHSSISIAEEPSDPAKTASQFFDKRKELADAQTRLRAAFVEESSNIQHDDQRAMDRRFDYTPLINAWIRMLAENEKLKDLVETSMN